MTPQQYEVREALKKIANPDGDNASWHKRKQVEATANIAIADGHCRRSELGCALCDIAGVTCEKINGLIESVPSSVI